MVTQSHGPPSRVQGLGRRIGDSESSRTFKDDEAPQRTFGRFPKLGVPLWGGGGPHSKDHSIWGVYIGVPFFWEPMHPKPFLGKYHKGWR